MWPNPQFPANLVTYTEKKPQWKTLLMGSNYVIATRPLQGDSLR